MVNQQLLEACKEALKCIARLTPFPDPDAPKELRDAMEQAAGYADSVRAKLHQTVMKLEDNQGGVNTSLGLLRRLVEENDPFVVDDYARTYCFFCVEDKPNHSHDCIYTEAKKLLRAE